MPMDMDAGEVPDPNSIEDEEWDEDEDSANPGRKYASAPGSAFTGGGGYSGLKNEKPRSFRSAGKGNKKNAQGRNLANKDGLKRNIFSKKSNENIFNKMSQIIKSYCRTGGQKCG